MREIMRSLLSANLMITGILLFIGSIITFYGTTFMLNATNLGKRLAFLVVGAGTFGWAMINSFLFILYAPRGPKPAEIDGLNAYPDIVVKVFNRWGQLVFESIGYNQAWDGTSNGKELPTATYYYSIDLNDGRDPFNGPITIKR